MTATFEVLAEESRRRILDLLVAEERPVGDLVGLLSLSQPAVSKHLKVLREAGLVESRTDAQRRIYRVGSSRCERSTSGWRPIGGDGRRTSTPSNDTSRGGGGWRGSQKMTGADAEFGRLERDGAVSRLHYRRHLAQPPETVWAALTEDAHLAAWFPTTIEGERRTGAPLQFCFRESEGPPFEGEMLACEVPTLLELRWADDILRFELKADGPGCVLSLTVSFPEFGKASRTRPAGTSAWSSSRTSAETSTPWQPLERWRACTPPTWPTSVLRHRPSVRRRVPTEIVRVHRQRDPATLASLRSRQSLLTFSPLLRIHLHWRISYLFGGVRLAEAALFAGTHPIVGLAKRPARVGTVRAICAIVSALAVVRQAVRVGDA